MTPAEATDCAFEAATGTPFVYREPTVAPKLTTALRYAADLLRVIPAGSLGRCVVDEVISYRFVAYERDHAAFEVATRLHAYVNNAVAPHSGANNKATPTYDAATIGAGICYLRSCYARTRV